VSDERDSSADTGSEAGTADETDTGTRTQTAVANRPVRPTGKRTRRAAVTTADGTATDEDGDAAPETDAGASKNGSGKGKKPKTAKAGASRGNPIAFVWNYLKQVVAELRKVIWPNRKQMVSYTTVVLVFLAFMVALISGVDIGLAKLVMWIFG
jgi:preprotein translocase subunit SecE